MSERSSATLYGKGVFTTIAVIDGTPSVWDKHWRRLIANAAKLEIDISDYNESEVFQELTQKIESRGLKEGRARITFSDESESEIWSHGGEKKTGLSIITAERRPISSEFSLTISPHRINTTSPLTGIKSCNYLEHLLAHREASSRGFDEAIRLNERNEVATGCMANIFWMKDGKVYTPSLSTGCLAGTTREFILENVECEEVEAGVDGLSDAESIFLTSAGIGIASVIDFEGKRLSTDHLKLFTEEIEAVLFSG
jgi:branched-subunit amino acid aminotransferase/4-amino-4-deoxychorismate lyase